MKKIIISSYDDLSNPYYAGGGATAIHQVAKRLSSSYLVTVITGNYPGAKNITLDGVAYRRIGLKWTNPKLSQLIFQSLLPLYAMTEDYDLWIENFTPPFSTAMLQHFTSKPVIGLVHMLSASDMARKYRIPLPFKAIESFGLKQYRNFIVLSQQVKQQIQAVNSTADIFVIPNGVDYSIKVAKIPAKKHLLFIGRLEFDQKGLDLLLDAYSQYRNSIKYPLIIAGTGANRDINQVLSKLKALKLETKVKLAGSITGETKSDYFRTAAAVVVPSRFETYPLVILEALSFSVPVICFDIDGLKWLPEDCAIKVPAFDTTAFGIAMDKVSKDLDLRLIENGNRFVSHYSWDDIAKKYFYLINGVMKNSRTIKHV